MEEKKKRKGQENLIPLNKRTKEEQRKIASNGGHKSVEVRREKKILQTFAKMFGSLSAPEQVKKILRGWGIPEKDCINYMAIVAGQYQKAIKGDVAAFNAIRDIIGEKPIEKTDVSGQIENKIEIGFVGSDFAPTNDESEVDL